MGEVIHKATIVTSFDERIIEAGHQVALGLFPSQMVTPVMLSPVNSYASFAIMPCGSKSGWQDKWADDAGREAFAVWVSNQDYEDGSNPIEFVTVEYGSDLVKASK